MRMTTHVVVAGTLLVLAAFVAVPVFLAMPAERLVPLERLTVPAEKARPQLSTAERALGPLVQSQAGMPVGNPFALRDRGRTSMSAVPEPPPPLLQLPEPPLTPFAPAAPR